LPCSRSPLQLGISPAICSRVPSPTRPSSRRIRRPSIRLEPCWRNIPGTPINGRRGLRDFPVADHGLVLFMQAARWPDELRTMDRQHHRGPWHYINWPFKPDGQPVSVQTSGPEPVNILTALGENERLVMTGNTGKLATAWLFHLVGLFHFRFSFANVPRPNPKR
jgi:S1/P1 Nuclease